MADWTEVRDILKATFREWRQDDGLQWGAALAFYAVFSLAPVLLIGIAVATLFFGDGVHQAVLDQVEGLVGPRGAQLVDDMLKASAQTGNTTLAFVSGLGALIVGATTVFAQLKVALNRMWDVRSQVRGVRGFLRKRLFAAAMVAVIGFLLLVALIVSAALQMADAWLTGLSSDLYWLLRVASLALSFALVTLLFAIIFKVLPDVEIGWHDVWLGALATSALFTLGKWGIGLYLGSSSVASSYGAAGSLVVILIWVYYSSQILLLGAEFTQVHARRVGHGLRPTDDAKRID